MGWVCSTPVEIHFVSSLALEGFGQHIFCVLAAMLWVWSKHVKIYVESSLAGKGMPRNV